MLINISFISAHFHDFDWTKTLVRNICRYTPPEIIKEIILINQDRNSESHMRLQSLDSMVRVTEYPISEPHFQAYGHDHAAVLNNAISEVSGDYICIFDSDAHPMNNLWIGRCESIFEYYDAILALVPGKFIHTHPCFMFFKKKTASTILFNDVMLQEDTGRSVGTQMLGHGYKVFLVTPVEAFNGLWGNVYLNAIYHHNKGSFSGSMDSRIISQRKWQNEYFKKLVLQHGVYEMTFYNYFKYKLINFINRKLHNT